MFMDFPGLFDGRQDRLVIHPAQHDGAMLIGLLAFGGGTDQDGWEIQMEDSSERVPESLRTT